MTCRINTSIISVLMITPGIIPSVPANIEPFSKSYSLMQEGDYDKATLTTIHTGQGSSCEIDTVGLENLDPFPSPQDIGCRKGLFPTECRDPKKLSKKCNKLTKKVVYIQQRNKLHTSAEGIDKKGQLSSLTYLFQAVLFSTDGSVIQIYAKDSLLFLKNGRFVIKNVRSVIDLEKVNWI